MYSDDEMLMLSGIQHIAFCERQWALIHVEQQWQDNVRTVEGHHLHERVDDPFFDESRGDIKTSRSIPVVSKSLGLRGVADVVEFHYIDNSLEVETIELKGVKGRWKPRPVEYKRGKPKPDDRDAVQLCAQAMALEEKWGIKIPEGDLFYWQIRCREKVILGDILRERTGILAGKMHRLFAEGVTPAAIKGKRCALCSLEEICQPSLTKRRRSVKNYILRMLEEEL